MLQRGERDRRGGEERGERDRRGGEGGEERWEEYEE